MSRDKLPGHISDWDASIRKVNDSAASDGVPSDVSETVSSAIDRAAESDTASSTDTRHQAPTIEDFAASQDRLHAEGQIAKQTFDRRVEAESYRDTQSLTLNAKATTAVGLVTEPAETLGGFADAATAGGPTPGGAIRAITTSGAAILEAVGADAFTEMTTRDAVVRSAATLGADLATVEGALAANAHAWGRRNAGLISEAPFSGPAVEIAAQAVGLHEAADPGALGRATRGSAQDMAAIRDTINGALAAHDAGLLTPRDGMLADGWTETLPALTPDGTGLADLPGFTPAD